MIIHDTGNNTVLFHNSTEDNHVLSPLKQITDNYKLSFILDFQLDGIRANANQSCIGKSGQDLGNPELYEKLNTEMARTMMGGTLYDVDEALGVIARMRSSDCNSFFEKDCRFCK